MSKKYFTQSGFTLIELMVVILIIVILSTIGLVSFAQATKTARDGKRKTDVESVRQAMILYKQENSGAYPSTIAALVTAGYLSAPAPADPDSTQPYTVVSSSSSPYTFCVCAKVSIPATNGNNTTNANCNTLTSSPSSTTLYYCARQP